MYMLKCLKWLELFNLKSDGSIYSITNLAYFTLKTNLPKIYHRCTMYHNTIEIIWRYQPPDLVGPMWQRFGSLGVGWHFYQTLYQNSTLSLNVNTCTFTTGKNAMENDTTFETSCQEVFQNGIWSKRKEFTPMDSNQSKFFSLKANPYWEDLTRPVHIQDSSPDGTLAIT